MLALVASMAGPASAQQPPRLSEHITASGSDLDMANGFSLSIGENAELGFYHLKVALSDWYAVCTGVVAGADVLTLGPRADTAIADLPDEVLFDLECDGMLSIDSFTLDCVEDGLLAVHSLQGNTVVTTPEGFARTYGHLFQASLDCVAMINDVMIASTSAVAWRLDEAELEDTE